MPLKKKQIERMNTDALKAIVDEHIHKTAAFNETILTRQIANSLRYYYGQPFGNEQPHKSKVVSRDLADAVDWIMPSLMRIFANGKKVVEFEPQGPEDIELSEQATDYINYLLLRRNEGFKVLYQWFKDALLAKVGVVKHYWEEKIEPVSDYYTGLDAESLELLLSDENVDLLERDALPDGTFNVKIVKYERKGRIVVDNVPPEEFLINIDARTLKEAEFIAHRREMTKSDLIAMGYDEGLLDSIPFENISYDFNNDIRNARNSNDRTDIGMRVSHNPAMERAWVNECYIRVDYDGDGIAELRRVVYVGNEILENEEADCAPFSTLTPTIVPHKFYGLSLYDQLHDIQEIKSTLLRNMMDNMYLQNNGRYEVMDGQVNLDDLLNNAAGGVVRVKMQGAIKPLDTPALPKENFDLLGYFDNIREDRAGVSKTSKGLDDNTLHSNQAASSVNQVMNAAEQRVELIARTFAETGVRDLFRNMYALVCKHQQKEDIFRLRNKYVTINPANWRTREDLLVSTGIGNNNKDQQLLHLQRLMELQQTMKGQGGENIIVGWEQQYNLLVEIAENAGYPDFAKFFLDPTQPAQMQAIQALEEAKKQPTPEMIKAKAEESHKQGDTQIKSQEGQTNAQMKARELDIREREVATKEAELRLKEEELELEKQKIQLELFGKVADYRLEKDQERPVGIGDGK